MEGLRFRERMCRSICETEQLGKPAIERRSKPRICKKQLGYFGIQITVDIYGRLIPSGNQKAVSRPNRPFSATRPERAQKERAQLADIAP